MFRAISSFIESTLLLHLYLFGELNWFELLNNMLDLKNAKCGRGAKNKKLA